MRHYGQPVLNCNLVVLANRDPMSAGRGPHVVGRFTIQWRNRMTKFKLVSAALIATAMVATPAMAREHRAAVRQHTTATTVTALVAFGLRPSARLPASRGPFRLANPGRFTDRSASQELGPEVKIRRPDFSCGARFRAPTQSSVGRGWSMRVPAMVRRNGHPFRGKTSG